MTQSRYQQYYDYLAEHIVTPFYNIRLNNLNSLKLSSVLRRKNPYLFKAKNARRNQATPGEDENIQKIVR